MNFRDTSLGMYRTRRQDQSKSSYGAVLALVFAFALTGWLWFLFASKFFDFTSPEIGPLTTMDREEVNREVDRVLNERPWRPWSSHNLIMLDSNKLANDLRDRLFADDVAVEKSYPNVLRLKIKERQRSVVLASNGQYVNVDTSGVVTGDTQGDALNFSKDIVAARTFADDSHMPVIVMSTLDPLAAGFQAADPERIKKWLDVSRTLVQEGVKYRFMKVDTPHSSLGRFVSAKGYDIYINLDQPLAAQVDTYLQYMKTKPDENTIHEYLDIRIPGRVFVK